MDKEDIKKLAIEQLSKETNVADYFVRVDLEEEFVDRCILIAQEQVKKLNIDDVGNCSDIDIPNIEVYQVYLNGNWIADCDSFEEAESIANGNAMNGSINIERC